MTHRLITLLFGGVLIAVSAPVSAQTGALDGVDHVASGAPMQKGEARLTLSAGYGFTESVMASGNDSHQRFIGGLAASYELKPWLGFALRLDGRYDRHTDDTPIGQDDGWVGDPRLTVRAVMPTKGALGFGAQLNLWFPGSSAPSVVFAALSPEILGLATVHTGALKLHGNLGYRLDRSSASIENPDGLSLADRLSLGLSDSDAILLGMAASYDLGPAELLTEISYEMLIGSDAPRKSASPLRVAGGARFAVATNMVVQTLVEYSPGNRPVIDRMRPLVPVDPLLRLMVSLNVRFGAGEKKSAIDSDPDSPAPKFSTLSGHVRSDDGQALAGATVRLTTSDGETVELVAGADGSFALDKLVLGAVSAVVSVDGFDPGSKSFTAVVDKRSTLEFKLTRKLPQGQLRGSIRSYSGEGVKARVRISPLGKTIETDENGEFELDLAPGEYKVEIKARGHRTQRRKIRVEENGVTILNIDLRSR